MATRRELPERAAMLAAGEAAAKTFKPLRLPPKNSPEVGRIRTQLTRNVARVYRDAPAATVEQGRTWYDRGHEEALRVGRRVGGGVEQGAGIVAALSPSLSWKKNIPAAHEFVNVSDVHLAAMSAANDVQKRIAGEIEHHERQAAARAGHPGRQLKGGAPAHLYAQHEEARIHHMRLREEAFRAADAKWLPSQSTDNIVKAGEIRAGKPAEKVLPMQVKTGQFYGNLADPSDPGPITIDTHAHDASRLTKLPFKTARGLGAVTRYNIFKGAYANATVAVGEQRGHVTQAVVWQHWKNRYGKKEDD